MALAQLVSLLGGRILVTLSPKLHVVIEFASHEADDVPNVWDGGCHYGWLLRFCHYDRPEGRAKSAT